MIATNEFEEGVMQKRIPQDWNSLSELLFRLRHEEFLAGPFETELFHPETGANLGKAQSPPFLYRGEPAVYPSTMGSLWRAQSTFSSEDFEYTQQLVEYAAKTLSAKSREDLPFGEAVAYAQHYGFPTPLLDW